MEDANRLETDEVTRGSSPASTVPVRHALRHQEALWAEFLAMGLTAVDSLAKSIAVVCDGRLEVVREVKNLERASDRAEVRIEQECLRILALFEPVASDLRRMATVLKVNRDWERIADLSARIARRTRKLAKRSGAVPVPEELKSLAQDVLAQHVARLRGPGQWRRPAGSGRNQRRPVDRSAVSPSPRRSQGIPPPQRRTA